jgi:hypothetical protein
VNVTLVPGGESAVTVTSAAPLPAETVAGALDEAGGYRLSGPDASPDTSPDARAGTAAGSAAAPLRTLPVV